MSKTKHVTISLTEKQRAALKQLTGQDHGVVVFESNPTALTAKLAPTRLAATRVAATKAAARRHAPKVAATRVAATRVAATKAAARRHAPKIAARQKF